MLVRIGADNSGLKSSLKDSQSSIKSAFSTNPVEDFTTALGGTTSGMEGLISKFSGLAAVAAGGFGIAALVDNAVKAGDAAYKMSQRLGVSTQDAIILGRVLSLSGADTDTFNSAMMRLDKSYSASGTSGKLCRDTLTATGVTLTDTNGKLLPLTEQLSNMAAGYDKAKQSGQQQAFLMNTLGVKGLQLTKVFEDYNEKMKIASETKGIGLNPEEMHKLSLEMDSVKMQASQVGLVFGSALAPIAEELFPPILSGLKSAAMFLAQNKAGATELLTTLLKLGIAYKAISMGKSAYSTVKNVAQGLGSNAGEKAAAEELSAFQQKAVEKWVAASERGYLRKINAAVKSAQAESISADEAAVKIKTAMETIVVESEAASIAIRERFASGFAGAATSAKESAVAMNTALASTGAAAIEAAEVKTVAAVESAAACTAVTVESSAIQADAIATTGLAAEQAALTKTAVTEESAIACTEATEISSIAQAESMGAVGVAAEIAGSKAVTANNSAVVAANGLTLAEGRVAEAEIVAGDTAVAAGAKTEIACAAATTAVDILSGAVAILKQNWLLVAFATYEALSWLIKYNNEKDAIDSYNKKATVHEGKDQYGNTYHTKDVTVPVMVDDKRGGQTQVGTRTERAPLSDAEEEELEGYQYKKDHPTEVPKAPDLTLPTAQSEANPHATAKPKESDEDKAADKARHKEIEEANQFAKELNKNWDDMYEDKQTIENKSYLQSLTSLDKYFTDGLVSQSDYTADQLKLSQMYTVNMIAEQQKQTDAERGYQKSAIELAQSLQDLKDSNLTGSASAAATFQKEWDKALQDIKDKVATLVSQLNSIKNPDERNKAIKNYQDKGMMNQGDFTGKPVTSDVFSGYSKQTIAEVNKQYTDIKAQDEAYKEGNIANYQSLINSKQNIDDQDLKSKQTYMSELQDLWKKTNTNIYDDATTILSNIDSSLESTLGKVAHGTASAADVFKNFAQSVIDSLIKIQVQAAAASITSSFAGLFGTSSLSTSVPTDAANDSSFISSLLSTDFSHAAGGYISGAGTGTSDSIHAMLSNGEYVMTAGATKAIGVGTLNQLNHYATGGLVTGASLSSMSGNYANTASAGTSSSSNQSQNFKVNVNNYGNANVQVEDPQYDRQSKSYILNVIIDGIKNHTAVRNAIKKV